MKLKVLARKFKSLARKIKNIICPISTAIPRLRNKIYNRSKCPAHILSRLNEVHTYINPCQVVIQPWKGRHNVYGVFMVPVEDQAGKILVIQIKGVGTYCGATERVGTSFAEIRAKPGHYLIKAHLRTRTSTTLIVEGYGKQLNDLQNWKLINYY
jgi:hypothetical protein